MKKVSVLTLSLIVLGSVAKADVDSALQDVNTKITNVQSSCSGIKKDFDTIFGLTVATTVSSGLGTVAAGGALATGILKESDVDPIATKIKKLYSLCDEKNKEQIPEFQKISTEVAGKLGMSTYYSEKYWRNDWPHRNKTRREYVEEIEKQYQKILGNLQTGLMAGATVTSAVSTGTSIGASVTASKLAEKMEACNKAISDLKIAISTAEAEEVAENNLSNARKIVGSCTGYSKDNINTLKKQMTASAIVSGIGTATAGAGTVTSALANSKKVRDDNSEPGKKKEKGLNLASNILAGITTGTSGASTILSATAIEKAKNDSKMAEECESTL